ncbi:MAG TPA: DUF4956 domain-containing protein [Candidatus Eisenbacteria bacterium]|nr:DUF4956 domain-containing protein [Candidatus Eisenbacteria bacterium]
MLSQLENVNLFPITALSIFANVAVALLCGLAVAWLYRRTYRGPGYSVAFVNSLVFLAMITTIMILAIGSNLARAFGLVGAMSIIRFRTAVKDTQDIVYIFFVLAIGMAAGGGYHKIAMVGTVAVGSIMYLFAKSGTFSPRKEEYLLQFSYSPNGDPAPSYLPVLHQYCRRHQVINTRSIGDNESLELSYYVRLRERELDGDFVRALRSASGVDRVSLYFDEEEF